MYGHKSINGLIEELDGTMIEEILESPWAPNSLFSTLFLLGPSLIVIRGIFNLPICAWD